MSAHALRDLILSQVKAFAKAKGLSLYLVGGFIRDALLDRDHLPSNVDFAIPAHALEVAQELAARLGGTYVCLDDVVATGRVVVSTPQERVELDLADFRGAAITDDLARRDFTINAMALPLEAWREGSWDHASLIDPLGGQHDLAQRRLRACFAETFLEDPVRILRAVRFAVEYDASLDPALLPLMGTAASRLATVAGERIGHELFAVLQTNRASWALQELNRAGVLDVLFPELQAGRGVEQGGYHHLDVLDHQLETVAQCDRILTDCREFSSVLQTPVMQYCDTMVVEGRSRKALIKLGGLLHDVGKPGTRRVKEDGEIWFLGHEQFGAMLVATTAERLRLSKRESEMTQRLVLYHLRPGHLSREPHLTPRAIYRFFRDLGDDGPACLLLWWADRMATRGPASRLDQIDQQRERLEELLHAYFLKPEETIKPPRLIDGHQLMDALGLAAGPRVGQLLRAIEEAQAEGTVHSTQEALSFAKSLLNE